MMNTDKTITTNDEIEVRHGHVFSPASRAYFAWQAGQMNTGQLNQREAGKFFPATRDGLTDPVAPTDQRNSLPPEDGKIASANQGDCEFLDAPGTHWQKHNVRSGEKLRISWNYSASHLTRRWNYFITREDWNPAQPLSRSQFESKPFYQVELTAQPFWSSRNELTPPKPTIHEVTLPKRSGYHVLLAVWEVADTGNAFYQVVDLNFGQRNTHGQEYAADNAVAEAPTAPANLHCTAVTANSVAMSWEPSTATHPLRCYQIYREGEKIAEVPATQFNYIDNGLQASTAYRYFVAAQDVLGHLSVPGNILRVVTEADKESDIPLWQLGATYSAGVIVRHNGKKWLCLQTHTAVAINWAPGSVGSASLWKAVV
jgi:chitin-binding protein